MQPILRAAIGVVLIALACYTVGVVSMHRTRRVSAAALRFLLAGVAFDVAATALMILSSGRVISIHGVIGYSALAAMAVDTWLARRHRASAGEAPVPDVLRLYTRGAYLWWIVAFVSGGMLAAMNRP